MHEIERKTNEVLRSIIIGEYAKRFAGFRKKRWYMEWFLELDDFLNDIEKEE